MGEKHLATSGMGIAVATALAILCACLELASETLNAPTRCWLFDMGTAESPVEREYQRVTADTVWHAELGFGWTKKADGAFDRPRAARFGRLLRDGVYAKDDIVFRVNLKPGKYYIRVAVGDPEGKREKMSIYVLGQPLGEDLTTDANWWRGTPTSLWATATVNFTGGALEFQFMHGGTANSVQAIQVVPHLPAPFDPRQSVQLLERDDTLVQFIPAVRLFHARRYAEAVKQVEKIFGPGTGFYKAWFLTWVAGRLDGQKNSKDILKRSVEILDSVLLRDPGHVAARKRRLINKDFLKGVSFLQMHGYVRYLEETGTGWGERRKTAQNLLEQVPPGDPLYESALFHLGRTSFWVASESGSPMEMAKAIRFLRDVKEAYPGLPLVRMYLGEKVPWGKPLAVPSEGTPRWALLEREAWYRLHEVIQHWRRQRQSETGEFGGGWGDDVEMMRWWSHVALGCGSILVTRSMKKLADGVWSRSGLIDDGFFRGMAEVQYAAELTSDSQPALVALQLGDPVYVERCMAAARLFKSRWSAGSPGRGRMFKSVEIGAYGTGTNPSRAMDVPYHARALQPALWFAWYSRNPEATALLKEWADTWVEACLRVEKGKPRGVPPAAIAFPSRELGGKGNAWYNPKLGPVYYNFPGGAHLLFEHLIGVYVLTGDKKYLAPIEISLDLLSRFTRGMVQTGNVGGAAWCARVMLKNPTLAPVWSKWRILAGKRDYDDFLKKYGTPFIQWYLTRNKRFLEEGCLQALASLRYNFEMLTTEVRYTDRVPVANTEHLLAMTGGSEGTAGCYPTWEATWQTDTPHFAAITIPRDGPNLPGKLTSYRGLFMQFGREPIEVLFQLWALAPGEYELKMGPDIDRDDRMDEVRYKKKFHVERWPAPFTLFIEPGTLYEVVVRQLQPASGPRTLRPDLAVCPADIFIFPPRPVPGKRVFIAARVHNIGAAPANNVVASIYANDPIGENLLARKTVNLMDYPRNLEPQYFWVWQDALARTDLSRIVVVVASTESKVGDEITQVNNRAQLKVEAGKELDQAFARWFFNGELSAACLDAWVDLARHHYDASLQELTPPRLAAYKKLLKDARDGATPAQKRMMNRLQEYISTFVEAKVKP